MAKPTKIILDKQSDLILTNARIVGASGIVKSDLPGLVNDLSNLDTAINTEENARIAADAGLSTEISVERGRIDAILAGATADLDQFVEIVNFVNGIDMTNDQSLLSAVTTINTSISTETSDRIAGDAAGASALSAEISRATVAETKLTTDLSTETADRIAGDVAGASALSAEIARATSAEVVLQSNIDTEKSRIDAILAGATADLDQFVEIVNFVNGIDMTNDNALLTAVTNINSSIDTETAARIAGDATGASALSAETAARIAGDAQLSEDLSTLQTYVNTTISDTITVLTDDILAETTRATEAEQILRDDLDAEIAARIAADEELDVRITDIISNTDLTAVDSFAEVVRDLTAEITRATAAEAVLQSAIDTEITAREAAIAEEHAHHTAAEELLTTNLDAEVVRATAAEGVLQTNIDTEKARIDAILDGSTVDLDQFAEVVSFVQSIDLTNDDALLNAVIGIEDSISDEAAERQAADSAIEDSISSLESNINSELSTLTNSLNTEIENRISDIETVEGSITDLTETLDAAVLTINDSIDAVIASVAEEHAHHTAAEVTLQANIDVEKGRIDAILQGSDVNLDQFMEVVDFVNSIDLENDEALMNAIIGIENSIDDEIADRESADLAIQDTISSLESTLSSNISTLTSSLDQEIADRINAIEIIEDEISDLTDSLDSSVLTINDSIDGVILDLDAEVIRATAAEGVLQTNIDTEKARIDAILLGSDVDLDQFAEIVTFVQSIDLTNDEALLNAVIGIENSITDEASAREAADNEIEDSIASLESNLNSEISTLTSALNTEIDNRISDIASVEGSIADLSETVDTAVIEINDSIDGLVADLAVEVAAREAAIAEEHAHHTATEAALQSAIDVEKGRIDAILQGSDVDLDQFAEVVTFVQSIDLSNDDALLTAVTSINDAIDAEVVRATAAEADLDATKLDLAGGYMSGAIDMGGNSIDNVNLINSDLIQAGRIVPTFLGEGEGDTIQVDNTVLNFNNESTIVNLPAPTNGGDATNKTYVDAGDAALASDLADLQSYVDTTVDSAISTLTADLATETAARIAAIDEEHAHHTAAEEALAADLANETLRATTQENVLNAALSTEVARAHDAEAVLQSNIDTEKARIDAILLGATADLDQFVEIVSFVQSIDLTNDSALLTAVTNINSSIDAEIAARIAGDATGASALAAEITRATFAEVQLSNDISDEVDARITALSIEEAARIAGDAQLSSDLADLQTYVDTTVDSAIATLTSDLSVETAARIAGDAAGASALSAEIARATTAEGILQLNINTEANERAAEDITLQGNIDIEATRAQSAETTIATNLATEISNRISAVSAEEIARIAGDATGASALAAEITRATASEVVLQSNIDTEKSRIDAILIGASANADNFAEIVALINSVDTANDTAFAGYVLSNDAALAAEITRATFAEVQLSNDISDEVDARITADTILQTNITTEVTRATAAEAALTSALSAEETSRIAGDDALQSSLNNEISDRLAADQSLQSALDAEVIRATTAEDMLDMSLNSEVLRATTAEGVLTTNLAAEVTRATAAEAALATDFANTYSKKVTVNGTSNGILTTFTLQQHVRIGSEMIYVNGLLMEEGEDYTTIITSGKISGVEFFVAPISEMKVRAYGVCGAYSGIINQA